MKPIPEKFIQDQCQSYLISKGYLVIRQNSGANVYENKGSKRFVRYYSIDSQYLRYKLTAGLSDLVAYKMGTVDSGFERDSKGTISCLSTMQLKVLFLEIKNSKGKQSKSQIEFEALCKDHGLEYYVIRSLNELKEIL